VQRAVPKKINNLPIDFMSIETITSTPNIISDRCPQIQKERKTTRGQGEPSMIRVSMLQCLV